MVSRSRTACSASLAVINVFGLAIVFLHRCFTLWKIIEHIFIKYQSEKSINSYFSAFGKAGKPLREFYDLIEKRYCDPANYPNKAVVHQTVRQAWNMLGNAGTMKHLASLMAEAEKLAETNAEKARVKLWKLSVYDYMKEGYDSYVRRSASPDPVWNVQKIASAGGVPDKVSWDKLMPREMAAASFGEVNWRQGVPAAESGHATFHAVCKTEKVKDRWMTRYAFLLDSMLNVPLAAGSHFFLNIVRVTNPNLYGDTRLGIYTGTSFTTVHTIDRAGKVILGK